MKTLSKAKLLSSRALAAVLLSVPSAQAITVVNIDFGFHGDHPSGVVNVPYSGTAAAPDSGTVWNHLEVVDNNAFTGPPGEFGFWSTTTSIVGLVDSQGIATGLGVTALATADTGVFGVLEGSPNLGTVALDAIGLMREYLIGFNAPQFVEITGLLPGTSADLYLYGAGDSDNRDTIFSITDANGVHSATTTGTISPNAGVPVPHELTLGGDYVVLEGILADNTGKIRISYDNGAGSNEAPFNGLQLMYVPEPSSALMFLGALSLGAVRRRTKRRK